MYSRKHYLKVLEEAKNDLSGINIEDSARNCGFQVKSGGADKTELTFNSLGINYALDTGTWDIFSDSGRVMPLQMRILVLHYLKRARPVSADGEMIPLRKLPGLEMYGPVIRRRSEDILIRRFGDRPQLLLPVIDRLDGTRVDMGDAAGRFFQLPKLPILVIIHEAEPGLPAEAVVMMDSFIPEMMHLEDLVVLAELLSHKLVNVALEFMEKGEGK